MSTPGAGTADIIEQADCSEMLESFDHHLIGLRQSLSGLLLLMARDDDAVEQPLPITSLRIIRIPLSPPPPHLPLPQVLGPRFCKRRSCRGHLQHMLQANMVPLLGLAGTYCDGWCRQ